MYLNRSPHIMRRLSVPFSALFIALITLGASQNDSKVSTTDKTTSTVVEINRVTPNLAPTAQPEEQVAQPAAQAPAAPSNAAAYQLNWYSINGGGATNASSTNYQMGLSVGQSVAGAASGTNYDVGIGFWYGAAAGGGGCPIVVSGDLNLSTTVTSADIIVAVNFVFKGGPTPLPCAANGDVNCNGAVTSADIIVLVNFVFKGGPPPCNTCTSPLAAGC
jgi:hypothetical protein